MAVLAAVAVCVSTYAQTYVVDSFRVQAGGGESNGAEFTVDGALETTDPGTSAGDGFTVSGSLIARLAVQSSGGAPTLFIQGSSEGITLTWADATGEFVLEETNALLVSEWTVVDGGGLSPVMIAPDTPTRFYRLRKGVGSHF